MEKQAGKILDFFKSFFSNKIEDIGTEPSLTEEEQAKEKELEVETTQEKIDEREEQGIPEEQPPIDNEVLIDDIEEETGEVEKHPYKIILPPELEARLGDPAVDHSYSALKYLESLGYKTFRFVVNPASSHKSDICDEIAKKNPWELTPHLQNAVAEANAKGYPVAPIFFLTHVNSWGYLWVHAPTSIDQIPNNAPGIHMYDDQEDIDYDKDQLLTFLEDVIVDRYTLAPDMFETITPVGELHKELFEEEGPFSFETVEPTGEKSTRFFSNKNKVKYGEYNNDETVKHSGDVPTRCFSNNDIIKKSDSNWIESVKPIKTRKNTFIRNEIGLVQLIPKGSIGIQIGIYNDIAKIFFSDLERAILVPKNSVKIVELKESDKNEVDRGMFVSIDGDLALAMGMMDENLLVYEPEYEDYVGTDEWRLLEIV